MSNHTKGPTRVGFRERLRQIEEHERQGNLRSTCEQIVLLFFLITFVAVSIWMDCGSAVPYIGEAFPAAAGWTTATGETVDLSALPAGSMDLTKGVGDLSLDGKSLCFRSVDTLLDVYADGQCIYSYRPDIPRRLGASYGMYVHTVAIPEGTTTLGLRLDPAFPGVPAALDDVMVESGGQYMGNLFRDNLFAFGLSSIIVLIGLLSLAVGIFRRLLMNTAGLDFVSFGMLCILIGFIGFNDTMLLQVLTRHPSLVRVITYVCLIILPYPAMSFFASATGNGRSPLVSASLVVCLANFACQVVLTHRGITDYFYLVNISHITIGLTFVAIACMLARAIRRRAVDDELLRSLLIGLVACAVGGGLDVIMYHISQSYGSTGYSRLGMLVLAALMGLHLLREQTRALRVKQHESSVFIGELTTAFARIIDMKDSYTNGHSFRVAKYTAMLSRELGCDEETVEKYYRIALLHDVGKIGIPKSVLNKPGKLTDEEYDVIKSHATKGYDVLKDINVMPELATGAQSHHERPDGRGYPNHLRGTQIPRVAQIIAVADCFDAMYSNRPYRDRMNFEKVVSIIREVSGTQLTPDVVDAFLRLVEKGEFRDPDDDGGGTTESIDNTGR